MDRERGVLQHRIQIAPVRGGGDQALERIRSRQREQQETEAHESEHAHHAARETRRQIAARDRNGERPHHEDPAPQQQRALVGAPDRGHAIKRRQRGVGIGRDVQHRVIERHEGVNERRQGGADQHELARDRGPHHGHPARVVARRAEDSEERLGARENQREDQREMSELGNHQVPAGTSGGGGLSFERSRDFRRHVFLVVFREHFVRDEHAVLQPAMRHHALSVTEQVRKNLRIGHRHRVFEIGDEEAHVERSRRLFDAALHDHAAEPEPLARRHLARRDLGRIEEEHHVAAQRLRAQPRRESDTGNDRGDHDHALLARRHGDISRRRRASCFALASELSASTTLRITMPKPSANAGHT